MPTIQDFINAGFSPSELQYTGTTQNQQSNQTSSEQQVQTSQQQTQQTQQTTGTQEQRSQSENLQSTRKVLDTDLVSLILSGLAGNMTDEQRQAYAENLLLPQLNAGLEAAQQAYDTQALSTKQQQDELAAQLQLAIQNQQTAYQQNMADVQNAALARGMGRSSYLLQTMAGQGTNLAEAVRQLTEESTRKSGNLSEQLALAAQQNAEKQGRLKTDYASQLAAKVQELADTQRKEYNQNYLTAISSALGSDTKGTSQSYQTGTTQQNMVGQQSTVGQTQQNTTGNVRTDTTQTTDQTAIKFGYAPPGDNSGVAEANTQEIKKRYGSTVNLA